MFYNKNFVKNKYGAHKVEIDGIVFDSAKEAKRWCELSLLEKGGEIADLERQVPFELVPSQFEINEKGKKGKCIERSVKYVADFVYKDRQGIIHVEDTKGMKTPEYIIKRKLMLYLKNIRIEEI